MSRFTPIVKACAVASLMTSAAVAESPQRPADPAPNLPPPVAAPIKTERPKAPTFVPPELPVEEPASVTAPNSGFSAKSAFTTALASPAETGTPLTLPQSLTYSGASVGFFLTDTGTNKAVEALISNTANPGSAIFGQTNGSGAGVSGYNTGTKGVAGRFGVRNTESAQPAISATTEGTGPAVMATVTSSTNSPAVFGQSTGTVYYGVGVEGDGDYIGVEGTTSARQGIGVYGYAYFKIGVEGYSDIGTGVQGYTPTGIGVEGYSGTGYAVYGHSVSGYAGYFAGKVSATSYVMSSDRNAKTHIKPIDSTQILRRVDTLPITSWDFKTDLKKRHIGPMAQDFHAAFGLDGNDDKHINLTDMVGVSLAAIQELSRQMKLKDAEIARLNEQLAAQANMIAQLKSMADSFSTRMAVLEEQRGVAATQTVSLRQAVGAGPGVGE
jgi:hypothetical protein